MVKSAKLWKDINLQFRKLQDAENQHLSLVNCPGTPGGHKEDAPATGTLDGPACDQNFYTSGLQHKHWVLTLCTLFLTCEWIDRSVLSLSMESMKSEFQLSDMQTGMIASAALWVLPLVVMFMGRLADHVPRAKLLACGVLGWAVTTIATGSAQSFHAIVSIRMLAGLANCAGYPVAVSLLADFFHAGQLATAMGYFNAGMAIGGLLGMVIGGYMVVHAGWRWAFWVVGGPQVVLSVLLATTVREQPRAQLSRSWTEDIRQLLRLPTLLFMLLGGLLSGLMNGEQRFISALAKRNYRTDEQTVGLLLGGVLGSAGILAACVGGHFLDKALIKTGDSRMLLWCAVVGDFFYLVLGTCGLLAPSLGLLVTFLVGATFASSLMQGLDPTMQALARGRRATTQAMLELCWSVGMAAGPFLAGGISDLLRNGSCDQGCALTHSLLLVGGLGRVLRGACYIIASVSLLQDLETVDKDQPASEQDRAGDAAPAAPMLSDPTPARLAGQSSQPEGPPSGGPGGPPTSPGPWPATLGRAAGAPPSTEKAGAHQRRIQSDSGARSRT
ncbi:unnamed protein product [Prorocentrum cordatum]|uniref:Major facilitator superfamily (MFS) profile domain-containing protein n=1 Tax=Prorocentrum cordatum TaxID=2364126 RepID=A0ABN9SNR9_9DINO|nr:unnamed protein product [Polarella glacialis]